MAQQRMLPARSATTIGQTIKALRREQGLTQAQLAAEAHVSRPWLIGVERGTGARSELHLVLRVFDVLRAPLFAVPLTESGDRT
ncbi:MAG: helix-turn-helix domain-containing protein [Cellulomonadaceae bacterium]|jgi:transcriptional regulator with XRE-family HTH domain|nr:helix-turn-helix domain-containing protein [Cellulomonadaceae bacterium]